MQELYEDRASSTFPVINCGIIELRANRGIETCECERLPSLTFYFSQAHCVTLTFCYRKLRPVGR
jgi:hypothetical protein